MWNAYPQIKPANGNLCLCRAVRDGENVIDYFTFCDGKFKCRPNEKVFAWTKSQDFEKEIQMKKKPDDEVLVRQLLNRMSPEDLAEFFLGMFTQEEIVQIVMDNMTHATLVGIADEEWSEICFNEDLRREEALWRSGQY